MFVVFEGIDGSGKTTISNQVAERLAAEGLSVTHLRARGKFASAVTEAIRELGRDARNLKMVPQAELLLYVARDVQLIEEVLRPSLKQSDVVIADRFLYTPQVLGHYGRHLSAQWMAPILEAAAAGIEPELVVLVDVDPLLARARRKSAKLAAADARPPARKGLTGAGLQHRLRHGYLELAVADPDRWLIVKNDAAPLEESVARLVSLVREARHGGTPAALRRLRDSAPPPPPTPPRLRTAADAMQAFLSWIDQRAQREPSVAAYVLSGMTGADIDPRRRALATRAPEVILAGLGSLGDATSWELRDLLKANHPRAVALSLMWLPEDDARAVAMRQSLVTRCAAEVALSLNGMDTPAAWELRDALFDRYSNEVVSSLARVGGARAWELRERWLAQNGASLERDYDVGRVAARSVTGRDEEAAWRLRERAQRVAPVAALQSLEGLRDPRSWVWRRDHLFSAPKVVMGTLKGMSDPAAWELRKAVAADCKEALDSVVGLDDPEAWELREAHADRWPSTVVKTLGALAKTPRGTALVARQLGAYPENISLLKHVALIR